MDNKLFGHFFKNPVLTASGTSGNGKELDEFFDISKLGGFVTSAVTLNRKIGNPGNRILEINSGMMNSIGLENDGLEEFIKTDLPFLKTKDTVSIINLGGNTYEDYLKAIDRLNETEIDIIELNISCPNVKEGGLAFGMRAEDVKKIVKKSVDISKKPIIVKLTPNGEPVKDLAMAAEDAGADGISLVNTFNGLAIDIYNRKPVFENITAGVSGPAIKPIALNKVREVSKAVDIPVIGLGGISNYKDAIEFIMAGAHLIQVGSAAFTNPNLYLDIIDGIEKFMKEENIKSLDEIRGII